MRTPSHHRKRNIGLLVGCWLIAGLAANVAAAAELTAANYEKSAQGADMSFTVEGLATEPFVFVTETPPRLVLEFSETFTDLPASPNVLNEQLVRSFTTISDGARTRVIVELQEPVEYNLTVNNDQVQMRLLAATQVGGARSSAVAVPTATAGVSATSADPQAVPAVTNTDFSSAPTQARGRTAQSVQDIDFRRTSSGGGRIVFVLTSGNVSTAVNERGDELLVDMMQTTLPENLARTLDVQDFATPVARISTAASGDNTRATVRINGDYSHRAYFDGSDFIVEVEPVVQPQAAVAQLDGTEQFFQNREYSGDRVTFNFQDIPVRSVLQLIADVSDLNIVVSDSVTGNLTLRLQNVPWDQALDLVLDTKNLDKRQNGNVLWIAPTGEIAAREQQLLQAQQDKMQLEPLRTLMISVSYAEATALANLITSATGTQSGGGGSQNQQGLISNRGSVTVDERTNTLLITDTADNLEEINALIKTLDRPVRQVLIESRIVIANDDFAHELGVRFGVTSTGESDNGSVFTTSGSINATDQTNNLALANRLAGRGSSLPNFINDDVDDGEGILTPSLNNRLNVNLPASNPAGRIGFSVLAADFLLDLELSALESEGRGEVISTPRVVTANQAEAFIQQGVEIPFEQATSSGASNVQFREAVLELRATPLITPDDRVQLQLSVKQDTVGEIFPTAQGGQVPSIDTRELSTRVLIENGETIVLGGIFTEETSYSNEKVPLLGDIPVLGTLFRRRSNSSNKSELLMFVTPTILEERVRLP